MLQVRFKIMAARAQGFWFYKGRARERRMYNGRRGDDGDENGAG